jgi:rare lipoprotein A (peptidoglycan hydrolase)
MHSFRRDRAVLVAVLCTVISLCTACAAQAAAGTGGAAMPDVLPATTGGTGYGDPGRQSLVVRPIAVLHRSLVARGTLPGAAGRKVVLQRLDAKRGWRNVARARVHSTSRFEVAWKADRMGAVSLRAVASGHRRASASSSAAPIAKVMVYRPAMATFYGPGFFGEPTACGQVLAPDTLGLAHRTLPCGTLVAVTYAGREIVVPVIDRGPFHAGFSWDLSQATADALGFTGSGEIGYARLTPAR